MFVRSGLGFLAGSGFGGMSAGDDVEERWLGGGRGLKASGCKDGFEFAGAYYGVDFGDGFLDFVAVALD
jgi:hypothetical protein